MLHEVGIAEIGFSSSTSFMKACDGTAASAALSHALWEQHGA